MKRKTIDSYYGDTIDWRVWAGTLPPWNRLPPMVLNWSDNRLIRTRIHESVIVDNFRWEIENKIGGRGGDEE